jgi:hypothetical protein
MSVHCYGNTNDDSYDNNLTIDNKDDDDDHPDDHNGHYNRIIRFENIKLTCCVQLLFTSYNAMVMKLFNNTFDTLL